MICCQAPTRSFENAWRQFHLGEPPIGWMLLGEGAANRLRFHSLPASKQYADTDEELFAELDRDNDSGFQTSDLVNPLRSEVGP